MATIKTRMTPCSYIVNVVLARLKSTAIPGIKAEEIIALPEGKPPPSMGERYIVISPESIVTVRPDADFRGEVVYFRINLIQRMRSTPNDRQGIIYTDNGEMHDTHQTITDSLQSLELFVELNDLIAQTETTNPAQKRFSIAKTFVHRMTTLNPTHLYPGFFLTQPSSERDKIAGYMTYQTFQSPTFYPKDNPLSCA
jgi:hypothetical protein